MPKKIPAVKPEPAPKNRKEKFIGDSFTLSDDEAADLAEIADAVTAAQTNLGIEREIAHNKEIVALDNLRNARTEYANACRALAKSKNIDVSGTENWNYTANDKTFKKVVPGIQT